MTTIWKHYKLNHQSKSGMGENRQNIKMRADSNIRIMSIFYKVIIQTVLLYGSESWVLNEDGKSKLRSFHHRCARFLTGRYITKIDEQWVYPETKKTLELAHLLPIEDYILKRINTIKSYALGTEIYNECITKSLYIKNNNSLQWWTENDNNDDIETDNNNDNNNISNNNNNNNNNDNMINNAEGEYDTYDMNEIELEWWLDDDEITNNETENIVNNNLNQIQNNN